MYFFKIYNYTTLHTLSLDSRSLNFFIVRTWCKIIYAPRRSVQQYAYKRLPEFAFIYDDTNVLNS